jgi:hypothetical protein
MRFFIVLILSLLYFINATMLTVVRGNSTHTPQGVVYHGVSAAAAGQGRSPTTRVVSGGGGGGGGTAGGGGGGRGATVIIYNYS